MRRSCAKRCGHDSSPGMAQMWGGGWSQMGMGRIYRHIIRFRPSWREKVLADDDECTLFFSRFVMRDGSWDFKGAVSIVRDRRVLVGCRRNRIVSRPSALMG